jgi:GNAT superfamily N-acetyltransferase
VFTAMSYCLVTNPLGSMPLYTVTNRDIHSYWRGHRTVILPEFQGMGIGTAFSDAIAEMYVSKGMRYFSKTAHPSFGEHREKSPLWRATSTNKKSRKGSYLLKDGSIRAMPGYGGNAQIALERCGSSLLQSRIHWCQKTLSSC